MKEQQSASKDVPEHNNILSANLIVGNVIFTFFEAKLKILLIKIKGADKWMIPWDFVRLEEGVDETAYKIIKERTGVNDFYISQFHLFGKYNRFDYEKHCDLLTRMGFNPKGEHNPLKYTALMGYYAFVRHTDIKIPANPLIEKAEWFDIDKIPRLYFEHNNVITRSFESIKQRIGYLPLGYALLPEKFTMPELRIIYELFLGHELDRRNFQRKMLSTGLMIKSDEKIKKGAHKSPYLYSFNVERYENALRNNEQLMLWTTM